MRVLDTRLFLVLVLLSCLSACGGQVVEFRLDGGQTAGADGGPDADTSGAPTVIATLPDDDAVAVSFVTTVAATFSTSMDGATIDATSFTLRQGVTAIAAGVAYQPASDTAVLTPDVPLLAGLRYTATVTTGAEDASGVALVADHTWSFTTGANDDPPMVIATSPLDGAVDASINTRPTATFSKAMAPATLTTLTFTVRQGATPVSGVVTLDGATNTARFAPQATLGLGLLYTATVTTGAEDTGGQALVADYSWDFTTDACSLQAVPLGGAARFAVLAGSTVTSTGPTVVTGDLGVSPGTAVTGFGPGTIVGSIHAGNPTAALGIADLTTAYNDAAGRSLCAQTVAGNLGGMTLTPGLYKSTSSLEISSGNLTLDAQGDADAVFIFQMASTLTTTSGRQVILVNGAQSSNVFWQVGTSATLGTTSAFVGTIMADQSITLGTGASLDGRALARIAAVTLDSNPVTRP